jgi:NADPH:quinone reductase-like Zn-dependent oxidoreductase
MLVLTPASAAQLNNNDLKHLDGTWQGKLRTYRRDVSKGASLELTGEAQKVRLEIRRTPTDMRIRNANGQWAPINATKGDFFSLFKYQTAPGTLVGSFVRSGHDQDGLWTEYQALYFTTPVIDARYPLAALPAALDHLDRGGFGKIVVEVA